MLYPPSKLIDNDYLEENEDTLELELQLQTVQTYSSYTQKQDQEDQDSLANSFNF